MKLYNRRSIRYKKYDYAQPGDYFITICTENREHIFGKIENGKMKLNQWGMIVKQYCIMTENHFQNVHFDTYIIMSNHFHGIIKIKSKTELTNPAGARSPRPNLNNNEINIKNKNTENIRGRGDPAPTGLDVANSLKQEQIFLQSDLDKTKSSIQEPTLGQIIGYFKYGISKQINLLRKTPGIKIWQRNYYEHIIRDCGEYSRISKYIENNPKKWEMNFKTVKQFRSPLSSSST